MRAFCAPARVRACSNNSGEAFLPTANSADFASQRLWPLSVATGSFSVPEVLQPVRTIAANSAANDASFQGMKPPFQK
jgi:hypothetical protein